MLYNFQLTPRITSALYTIHCDALCSRISHRHMIITLLFGSDALDKLSMQSIIVWKLSAFVMIKDANAFRRTYDDEGNLTNLFHNYIGGIPSSWQGYSKEDNEPNRLLVGIIDNLGTKIIQSN